MNAQNTLFGFALTIGIMLFGFDIVTRTAGPRFNAQYRRVLRATYNFLRRNVSRFVRWAWRGYKQFIIGTAFGVIATLYFTGHFG
jgi:hypothetical protein